MEKDYKGIVAIDISLPVTAKSEGVSYMALTEDQFNFFKGLMQNSTIMGFEWTGKGEFGIVLGKKKSK